MSLLNLVHHSVVIKFADSARNQFQPEVPYVFHLAGVDAMGFLYLQNVKPGSEAGHHEVTSDPYWINKDLVLEIHEFNSGKSKETLHYHQLPAKTKVSAPATTATSKPEKPKPAAKQKPAVS